MDNINHSGVVDNTDFLFDLGDFMYDPSAYDHDYSETASGITGTNEMTTPVASSSTPISPKKRGKNVVNLDVMFTEGLMNKEPVILVNNVPQNNIMSTSSISGLIQETRKESVAPISRYPDISLYAGASASNTAGQGSKAKDLSEPQASPKTCHDLQMREMLLKEKFHQPHTESSLLITPDTQYGYQNQHQQTLSYQPPAYSQVTFTATQDQRNSVHLQRQHRFGLQNSVNRRKQHQSLNHTLQKSDMTGPPQNTWEPLNQLQSNFQQHGITHIPNDPTLEGVMNRFQTISTPQCTLGAMSQEPKRQEHPRGVFPEALAGVSVNAMLQNDNAASSDWRDQVYLQILTMKEMYLPVLIKFHKKVFELSIQTQSVGLVRRYKKSATIAHRMIQFLNIQRADLHSSKEKILSYMKLITSYANAILNKDNAGLMRLNELFPWPSTNLQAPQLLQDESLNRHFSQLRGSSREAPEPAAKTGNFVRSLPLTRNSSSLNNTTIMSQDTSKGKAQRVNTMTSQLNSFQIGLGLPKNMLQLRRSSLQMGVNVSDSSTGSFGSSAPMSPFNHLTPELIQKNLQLEKMKQPLQQPLTQQQALMPNMTQNYSPRPLVENYSKFFVSASPQSSQHSNSSELQFDANNVWSPHAGSPFTPLTPSSTAVEPPAVPGQVQCENDVQNNLPVADTSPEAPLVMEKHHNRLIEAVKSMSQKALSATLRDIESVMRVVDKIPETSCGAQRNSVGEDFISDKQHRFQDETDFLDDMQHLSRDDETEFKLQYGRSDSGVRMRREIEVVGFESLSLACEKTESLHQSPGEASETSPSKKRRIQNKYKKVREEIDEVNRRLVETSLDAVLDPDEYPHPYGPDDGTIVSVSYSAVCFPHLLGSHCALQTPRFHLRLLVPVEYPDCSPLVLDAKTDTLRCEESERAMKEIRMRFEATLLTLSQPMSLKEMARAWNSCGRAVLSELSVQRGGESFSSSHGRWESCVTTS